MRGGKFGDTAHERRETPLGQLKAGEPFGLDQEWLAKIDWDVALKRVIKDQRSDFIYAPHLSFLYARAGSELLSDVKKDLADGKFSPGLPMTIEAPKTYRIQVGVHSKRLGPNYSRPGSILMPKDRLFYQALVDQAAPIVEAKTDVTRSFSHTLAPAGGANMFLPTRTCWNRLQKANQEYATKPGAKYILKMDIANYFGSVNQHRLINVLNDVAYPGPLLSRLESLLTGFTGDRNSRGILQGMFPSDLLGNFYLNPIDQFLSELNVPSARYVDDLYIFVDSVDSAEHLLRKLIPELRSYDLVLNEAKSKIIPATALHSEEPDLEALFEAAVQEVSDQIQDEDFDADYGFQADWDDDGYMSGEEPTVASEPLGTESDGEDDLEASQPLHLAATKVLFDSIDSYPGAEENIERFCLPLFSRCESDYAVNHVIEAFKKRPSMSQIYSAYLSGFLDQSDVSTFLASVLTENALMDWQRMWILAALMRSRKPSDVSIKASFDIASDGNRHEALRAAAAIFVGEHGNHSRRNALRTLYPKVPAYVQSAIYFSSRVWAGVEKTNAKAAWGALNPVNQLLTKAVAPKKAKKPV